MKEDGKPLIVLNLKLHIKFLFLSYSDIDFKKKTGNDLFSKYFSATATKKRYTKVINERIATIFS